MEGKGGRRRKREEWKEHKREGGRVKREDYRQLIMVPLSTQYKYVLFVIFLPSIHD